MFIIFIFSSRVYEAMDTSTESVKCGCIYLTKEGTLFLACAFCGENYYTLEALSLHIKYHLPETETRTKIKREISISYSEYMPSIIQEDCTEGFVPHGEADAELTTAGQFLLIGIKRENSISFGSDNESTWKDSNLTTDCFLSNEKSTPSDNYLSADTTNHNGKRNKRSNCISIVNNVNTSRVIEKTNPAISEIPKVSRTNTRNRYTHKCSFCDLCFPGNRKLVDHENTHTGRQPYQCKFCPKTFAAASSLWSHNKLHTQDRQHKCSVCDKTFAHKFMRDRHNREQHLPNTDPQRYFECTKCDLKFITHRQMCYHRAIHKNKTETFTCDYCQRQFKSRSILVDHMQKLHERRKKMKKQRTRKIKADNQ